MSEAMPLVVALAVVLDVLQSLLAVVALVDVVFSAVVVRAA